MIIENKNVGIWPIEGNEQATKWIQKKNVELIFYSPNMTKWMSFDMIWFKSILRE